MSNATDKLNTLESVILSAEDSAEDARWQQAEEVHRLLDAHTQRDIAAGWINGRTGKSYNKAHVGFVDTVWRRFGYFNSQTRPTWTTAYYTVQQGSDELIEPEQRRREWSDAHEARAPRSEATARQFVENLLEKSPPAVVETVYRGLTSNPERRRQVMSSLDDAEREAIVDTVIEVTAQEARAVSEEHKTGTTLSDVGGADFPDPTVDVALIKAWRFAREAARIINERGVWVTENRFEEMLERATELEAAASEIRAAIQEALNERSFA